MPAAETPKMDEDVITKEEAASLKADMELIRKDVKQLISDIGAVTKHEADFVTKKTNELSDAARDAARERRDEVETYVKDHPLGALAAAAGVGFVLALLVGR